MNENENKLVEILKALNRDGMLSNIVLIGSWCLEFYKDIFEGFKPLVRTTDIDFYVPSAQKTFVDGDVIGSLKELNYDHIQDTMTNKSKFISSDGFEIEFLTKLNREGLSCVRVGNTGIYAESLSYVEIYSSHYVEIEKAGCKVKVASPASFVIQKVLINDRRGAKADKDKQAIGYVLSFIPASKKASREFWEIMDSLPKKWEKKVELFVSQNNMKLPSRV